MNFDPAMTKNEHIKREKDGLDVWGDIQRYAQEGFKSISKDDVVRLRWYGVYQQKPNDQGYFMWRIKLPGGRLNPLQLRQIAKVTHAYGRGFSDITTRQDIQIHWISIESFPDAFDRIYNKAGLYTHFACGDTPRNVVSCPLDGVITSQIVDLGGLVQRVSDMFKEAGKEFSNLPRKFKPSLAACPLHCHQPQINDVSAFGVVRRREGREEHGLGIMVGGGLSDTPHYAQGLRVFVPGDQAAGQIPAIFRAVAEVFRDADELRYKRGRARLKFLVADRGWQWMREQVERRLGYALEHDESIVNPIGALHTDHMGSGEQVDGLHYVGAPVPRGRWTSGQMEAVADLAERFAAPGKAQIRLSQKQNLLLVNIPRENVPPLSKELESIGLPPGAPLWRQSLVSCTGSQFCNLAVVETKERAREILEYLEREVEVDTPIMVSITGCPNACAQYQIADIGLTGIPVVMPDKKKVDGYNVLVGGCLGENPEFGVELVKKVPAHLVQRVIGALVGNYKANRIVEPDGEMESFRDFVARHEVEQLRAWSVIADWTPPPARPTPPA
jgi:sulfite reductase beta subunit-like hemoprotein